jgi:methionyl aminopeptidase
VPSPDRPLPDHIPRPDYYTTGQAEAERRSDARETPPVLSEKAIQKMRAACKLGREILDAAHRIIRPGVTTDEIDRVVHEYTVDHGAYPAPLHYFDFPKSVCTSVNEVVCHGIPDMRELEEGDIVNVDVSAILDGYHSDLNETFVVGSVSSAKKALVKATHDSLMACIKECKPGVFYRDMGGIITKFVNAQGFQVDKTYCGHGIGAFFHCAPNIPHYAGNKAKFVMKPGHCFTIEPMINMGSWKDTHWPDGWTAVTKDGLPSAQFEHTLLVNESGVEILTARLPTSPPLWWEVDEGAAASTMVGGRPIAGFRDGVAYAANEPGGGTPPPPPPAPPPSVPQADVD